MEEETITRVEMRASVSESAPKKKNGLASLLDTISFWLTAGALVLTPLVISFTRAIPIAFSKHTFLVVLVSLAFVAWAAARILTGTVRVPKSTVLWSTLGLAVLLLPSALLSGSWSTSFFGIGSEASTYFAVFSFVLLAFLTSIHIRSPRHVVSYLSYLLGLGILAFFVQMLNIFVGPFSMFGAAGNIIGKWNDLGAFYGLVVVLSLFFTQVVGVVGRYRVLAVTSLVTSLVGLVVINFPNAWYLVALFSVVVGIAAFSRARLGAGEGETVSPLRATGLPAAIFLFALLFIFGGAQDGFLGKHVINFQLNNNITSLEARPGRGVTFAIIGNTFKENPVFGAGLNRFSAQWVKYRTDKIIASPFWNVDFSSGIGYIPTFAVTAGVFGLIAWLLLLGTTAVSGFKYTFSRGSHHEAQVASLTVYAGLAYLLVLSLTYVTDSFLIGLTFAFLGLMVSTSVITGMVTEGRWNLFADARVRFPSILALVLLLLFVATGSFTSVKRYFAFTNFQRALVELNSGTDLDEVRTMLQTSVSRAPIDVYFRALAEVETLRIRELLNNASLTEAELRAEFTSALAAAVGQSQAAIDYDDGNYLNYLALGRVYASLTVFPLEDAPALALGAYEKAEALAPNSPLVALEMARVHRSIGDNEEARRLIKVALERKPNYTQALFELSLIEIEEDNLDEALELTDQAATLSPDDEGLFFQLGVLRYQNEEYEKAAAALERAVEINNDYSNALYFLALSYDQLGENEAAIAQMERVVGFNPENEDVQTILDNLKNGDDALRGVEDPIDLGELPLEEEDEETI